MSAIISNKVMMKEVLKATGFDCPDGMENKTFEEAASGGDGESRTPQELNITANGSYNTPDGVYYDPISVNVPLPDVRVTIVGAQANMLNTVGTPVVLFLAYPIAEDPDHTVWFGKEQINTRDIVAEQTYRYRISYGGYSFDITLKKQSVGGNQYRITTTYKDRGTIALPLSCFLIIGTFN